MELIRSTLTNPFKLITSLILVFMMAMLVSFLIPIFSTPTSLWYFFIEFQFVDVMGQTLILMFGSVIVALTLSVYPAYIMSFYRFKYKKWFEILFILPLALPSYVYGYLYGNMTNVTGIIYNILTPLFNPASLAIQHTRGAMFLFGLSLYPYLYLAIRAFLVKQPQALIASARVLGLTEWQRFYRILLPLLKPVIIGSSVLIMMEVINDFGLVSYFGLNVVSTSMFQLWFNGNDLNAALRLGTIVIVFVVVVLMGEILFKKHPKYTYSTTQLKTIKQESLRGVKRSLFLTFSMALFTLTFGLPFLQIIVWLTRMQRMPSFFVYLDPLLNTMIVGGLTATVIVGFGLMIANVTRYQHLRVYRYLSRLLTLGYSLPGVLIAMAVFLFFIPIENVLQSWNIPFSFRLTTSIGLLITALVIRYLAIGIQFVESSYQKIGLKFTYASYTLKRGKIKTLIGVDMPMMAQSLVAALLIILIDVFKELPLTLFLRPFNFDTLATRLYQFANDEQLAESSPMILMLWGLTAIVVYGASQLMIKQDAYEFND